MMSQNMIFDERVETKKIGVIADTHDNMKAIKKAVEFFNDNGVETVIHAGDIVSPFTAREFKNLNCKMILIYGNNDGDKLYLKERFMYIGEFHRDPYFFELYGKKVALTHIPNIVDALSEKYDIVIYGHTHERDLRKGKGLILNPGEGCGYLTGVESVALLYPEKMEAEIVEL